MSEFWQTLIKLIQQCTIADTASVFTIIGGIATVVAAVGAIIAVVITKRIAREQIVLAKKQNDISNKQADISVVQNKISIFEKRQVVINTLLDFFKCWEQFTYRLIEEDDPKKQLYICEAAVTYQLELQSLYKQEHDEDSRYLSVLLLKLSIREKKNANELKRLFRLDSNCETYLEEVFSKYNELQNKICSYLDDSSKVIDFNIEAQPLFLLLTDERKEQLIDNLESQIRLDNF